MPKHGKYQNYYATRHYTLYFKLEPAERKHLASKQLRYVSGTALARLKPGDVLWLVNVFQNDLYLLGRLQVELLVGDLEVAQGLVELDASNTLDDWFAIANPYQVEAMRLLNINTAAAHLVFRSKPGSERLTLQQDRLVKAQEMLGLRQLTDASARVLETLWYDDAYVPQTVDDYLELSEDDQAYAEGRLIVRTVKQRQRNQRLIHDKKALFAAEQGHVYCEVCGFDFTEVYGMPYIEAHHTEPLSLLEAEETLTEIDSLSLLCANCHRAAHLRTPPFTIEELKALIRENKG